MFTQKETSRFDGQPVLIYEFVYGDGANDVYRFTDAGRNVSLAGAVYEAVPIGHGRLEGTTTYERKTLSVTVDEDNPVAHLFDIYPPDKAVRMTVRKIHLNDPDVETSLVTVANVLGVEFDGAGSATIRCRAENSYDRQAGLQETYQLTCRVALYSTKCAASIAAASHTVTVIGVSSNTVTLAAGWENGQPGSKYIGGMLLWTKDSNARARTILRRSGSQLFVSGVPTGLEIGDQVSVALGCNHHMDDCDDLHNNINNFRGCPWIPTKNPVNTNPHY